MNGGLDALKRVKRERKPREGVEVRSLHVCLLNLRSAPKRTDNAFRPRWLF